MTSHVPEVGAEVAADLADRVDDVLPNLLGDLLELVLAQAVEVLRAVDAIQEAVGEVMKSGEDEVGDLLELCRALRARPERVALAVAWRPGREFSGAVEPVLGDVGALAVTLVAALWLAESLVGTRHVQDVVDDLEQNAELAGEAAPSDGVSSLARARPRAAARTMTDAPIRRPVLSSCRRAQVVGVSLMPGNVEVLAADHAVDARSRRASSRARGQDAGRLTRAGAVSRWRKASA